MILKSKPSSKDFKKPKQKTQPPKADITVLNL